jgi:hypothetical protein
MTREAWTDERLDDLSGRVDEGFREARQDLRSFRQEVHAEFASVRDEIRASRQESRTEIATFRQEVKAEFIRMDAKIDAKFDGLNARFDSLQRLLLGAMVTVILSVIVTRL